GFACESAASWRDTATLAVRSASFCLLTASWSLDGKPLPVDLGRNGETDGERRKTGDGGATDDLRQMPQPDVFPDDLVLFPAAKKRGDGRSVAHRRSTKNVPCRNVIRTLRQEAPSSCPDRDGRSHPSATRPGSAPRSDSRFPDS